MKKICEKEELRINDNVLNTIIRVADGDVRAATNVLQSAAVFGKNISEEHIFEATSYANPKDIIEVLISSIGGNFLKARELLLNLMIKQGIDGLEIVKQLQKGIMSLEINENKKLEMIEKCGETEFRMVEGSDAFIQLQGLIANFSKTKED